MFSLKEFVNKHVNEAYLGPCFIFETIDPISVKFSMGICTKVACKFNIGSIPFNISTV
jgi:hypothetical protein